MPPERGFCVLRADVGAFDSHGESSDTDAPLSVRGPLDVD